MVMKKRGLSDVVAVTLIILLAIAAVVIVWAFVSSMLKDTGKQLEANCLNVNVKPVTCDVSTTKVTVQSGTGDAILTSLRIVVYSDGTPSATSDVVSCATPLNPLESGECSDAKFTKGKYVSVAGVIKNADNLDQVCTPSTEKIECK